MDDEQLWKKRFHVFAGVRLLGLATFFLGIGIAYSDLVRPGGWPAVGLVVALLGIVVAVIAPIILKRQWNRDR